MVVQGVDLDVYAGEIVGVAGITGSGREHVLRSSPGNSRDDGDVLLGGTPIANYRPRQAIEAGAVRAGGALGARHPVTMTVRENMSISDVGTSAVAGCGGGRGRGDP